MELSDVFQEVSRMFWGVSSVSEYFSLYQKGLCFCRNSWGSMGLSRGVSMMLQSSFNTYQDFSEGFDACKETLKGFQKSSKAFQDGLSGFKGF